MLITGRPGVGKTTAVMKIMEVLGDKAVGFCTREIRERGQRVGFEIVTTWGKVHTLAHVDIDGPKVSKYGVNLEALESVVRELKNIEPFKVLIVDEIGKMELMSHIFARWVESVVESNIKFVGTVPLRSRHPLVNRLKSKLPVWDVTSANRSAIPFRVLEYIEEG